MYELFSLESHSQHCLLLGDVKHARILVDIITLIYRKVLVLVRIFPTHFLVQTEIRIGSGGEQEQIKCDKDIKSGGYRTTDWPPCTCQVVTNDFSYLCLIR